ncbi:MAG: hypothetical protein ABFS23_07830 [Pseudomonadota bacterium]
MQLKVIIDDEVLTLNVPDALIGDATDFFDKMDSDMDAGWQMGREWVAQPNLVQRLQIVGNKLLTALENENHDLGRLMGAYILNRAPHVDSLDLDTSGEMVNTQVSFIDRSSPVTFASAADTQPAMSDAGVRAEAEKQVSAVFKAGRHYSYSVLNLNNGQWDTVTVGGDADEAEQHRRAALARRYQELANPSH